MRTVVLLPPDAPAWTTSAFPLLPLASEAKRSNC
jgi:hypothetical protein